MTTRLDMTPLENAVRRIETKLAILEEYKVAYQDACKEVRKEIAEEYRIAKDRGLLARALKMLIRTRAMKAKHDGLLDGLTHEERVEYASYSDVVGGWDGTPLGDVDKAA